MNHFKDKVAIVTGGASGIGRAVCRALGHREAAAVIVADINAEGARQTAASITAAGGHAYAAGLDVSQAEAVQNLVDETVSTHGRLDYMFNNAGIGIIGDTRDMELEQWQRLLDVNLWGVIYGTTSAYQVMVKQGFGHIVNTASAGGLFPLPFGTAYATSKYA
ncbi:MAG: SDR family oxidoreductase, partial [Chloroflexi bacterium]|nr:SDR family oxidoreductase [Chloroflexota bacterium]